MIALVAAPGLGLAISGMHSPLTNAMASPKAA